MSVATFRSNPAGANNDAMICIACGTASSSVPTPVKPDHRSLLVAPITSAGHLLELPPKGTEHESPLVRESAYRHGSSSWDVSAPRLSLSDVQPGCEMHKNRCEVPALDHAVTRRGYRFVALSVPFSECLGLSQAKAQDKRSWSRRTEEDKGTSFAMLSRSAVRHSGCGALLDGGRINATVGPMCALNVRFRLPTYQARGAPSSGTFATIG